jgi:hypothetical protein
MLNQLMMYFDLNMVLLVAVSDLWLLISEHTKNIVGLQEVRNQSVN